MLTKFFTRGNTSVLIQNSRLYNYWSKNQCKDEFISMSNKTIFGKQQIITGKKTLFAS